MDVNKFILFLEQRIILVNETQMVSHTYAHCACSVVSADKMKQDKAKAGCRALGLKSSGKHAGLLLMAKG